MKTTHFYLLLLLGILTLPAHAGTPLPGQIVVHPSTTAWLQYNDGRPFFLAGPGDPENFLYRGNINADGTRTGDQMVLINKLKGTGANSIYMQTVRSHGGDGDSTHNPFIDNDDAKGVNHTVLDQWETWFTEMDNNGIVIYLFFYDDSAVIWETGDTVVEAEKIFFEALVNRFEHHENLIWVIGEEYAEGYTSTRVSRLAQIIRNADDHDHVIAVHKNHGLSFTEFSDDPNIDQFAIQYNKQTESELHSGMLDAWVQASGKFNLNMSEAKAWGTGSVARKKAWSIAMGGAYVMVLSMKIDGTPLGDLEDLGRLRTFMESTEFYNMAPHDELSFAGTQFVLAFPGDSYIAYASDLGDSEIGLKGLTAGTYRLKWFDIVTGDTITQESVAVVATDSSWPTPAGIGKELALTVKLIDSSNNTLPTALPQSLTINQDESIDITLKYSDPDGPGPYTFTIASQPVSGNINGDGDSWTYTPTPGFTGNDSFEFKIHDGTGSSSAATISIETISSINQPPEANNQPFYTAFETSISISLTYDDKDGPGPYTVSIDTQPEHGSLTGSSNDRIYTPDAGFSGNDSFTWIVSDGELESLPARASITVGPQVASGGVSINNSLPVNYEWDVLGTDKNVYIDRNYTFSVVPDQFQGLDYLRTANDDKYSVADDFITFQVDQPVTVYVAHTQDQLNVPGWLLAWNPTLEIIETSDRDLHVYQKIFNAGIVSLGDNDSAPSMYSVLVGGIANPITLPDPETDTNSSDTNSSDQTNSSAGAFGTGVLGILFFSLIGLRQLQLRTWLYRNIK